MLGCLAQVTAGRTTAGYVSLAWDTELVIESAALFLNTRLTVLVADKIFFVGGDMTNSANYLETIFGFILFYV